MDEYEKWLLERMNNEQMIITRGIGKGNEGTRVFCFEEALDKYRAFKAKADGGLVGKLQDIVRAYKFKDSDDGFSAGCNRVCERIEEILRAHEGGAK